MPSVWQWNCYPLFYQLRMSRTELESRSSACKAHTLATGIPSYQVINTFACFYDKDFIENNVLKNLFHRCNSNIQSWNREIKEITTFKVYRVHSTYVWLRTGGSRWLQPLPPLNSKKDRIKMCWNTQKRCKKLRKKRETFYVFDVISSRGFLNARAPTSEPETILNSSTLFILKPHRFKYTSEPQTLLIQSTYI